MAFPALNARYRSNEPSLVQTLLTHDVHRAASLLRAGQLVAFPTETVYGLGADTFNPHAVASIFRAKKRPQDNPLIVHIAATEQLTALVRKLSPAAQTLIKTCFPGPVTVIAYKQPTVPGVVTGGLETIAIRMPSLPLAHAFLHACRTPVAAPSANLSGRPSPTTWEAVYDDLGGRIAGILCGDHTENGLESTIVDCTPKIPRILRTGVVSVEDLRTIIPSIELATTNIPEEIRSPGTRYRHYAPRAHVRLVVEPGQARPDAHNAYIGLHAVSNPSAFGLTLQCNTITAYAHALYDFFRRCESAGIHIIYCQTIPPEGLGRALMDRLTKAAAPRS